MPVVNKDDPERLEAFRCSRASNQERIASAAGEGDNRMSSSSSSSMVTSIQLAVATCDPLAAALMSRSRSEHTPPVTVTVTCMDRSFGGRRSISLETIDRFHCCCHLSIRIVCRRVECRKYCSFVFIIMCCINMLCLLFVLVLVVYI